ncbi:MAG: SUMF1/EgtB/PvdO family nonheme iron enzyme [Desulfobacterales bacterium]|nr:SUMF1/EgtB/PvdO family nonheme iron enzyme [Desulfobacterales bacterium]
MTVKKQAILILIAITFFYTFVSLPYSYSENRVALIIGNEAYESSPLDNPVNDAKAIAQTLKRLGFKTVRKENLNWQEMNMAIDAFGEKLLKQDGVGLFYYAGHGIQFNGKNYLIPVKSNIRHENEIKYRAVDAGLVLAKMENARNGLNIVILDACRDNPFARSFRSSTQGLAYMDAPTGSIIAYATAPGRTASDNSGYTSELIKQMGKPGQRLIDMFMNVRKAVRNRTNGHQVPWESVSLTEPFYFLADSGGVIITKPQKETSLTVRPNVYDAGVWINGKKMGNGTVILNRIQPGTYRIKVARKGYKSYEIRVKVKNGKSEEVVAFLEKIEIKPAVKVTKPVYSAKKIKIANSLGMEFVYIPPGTFMMGSPSGEPKRDDDEKQHRVTLTKRFYMQTTEVTVGQWKAFVRDTGYKTDAEKKGSAFVYKDGKWGYQKGYYWKNPGFSQTDSHPVTCVSWNDVQKFIKWLSQKENKAYRLPTEAEWEYACRAGTNTPFSFGKCLSSDQANYAGSHPLPDCPKGKYRKKTVSVASFSANSRGLYDMHGNVWEWCQDWYGKYPTGSITDPIGPDTGSFRVLRGGGWYDLAWNCRSASRNRGRPVIRFSDFGFRLVLSPGQ